MNALKTLVSFSLRNRFLSYIRIVRVSISIFLKVVYVFICFSFQCDNYEIRPGKHLGVCISVANNRLFVGSIPKNKTKENILEEFSKVTGTELRI